ncbi:mycothiol maleylpyruvate isomerase-like protein [Nocardioides albertanoniae]|uniref:Mycothiol maleylpyruvate isomerase-like protein n=1 Tax=Nocardioides albertanoniae TaxID=1175486 RepID=A0A543A6A3_9ACTN|nr:class I SAM-dependent methyltransferase [Nocardioides albertanoniae]TQL68087.1 mycothiol maleylpyruvate isomerase-like protein [Nocardioides albertanoniae]
MTYDAPAEAGPEAIHPEPDTKDWTWILDRPCPECGFVAGSVTADQLPELIRDNATYWEIYLAADNARERPRPAVWSSLEYAAHVRDVHRLFAERVELMLTEHEPSFANWDQDATARDSDYAAQDPEAVADELMDAADLAAATYEKVPPDAWGRRGVRSNGDVFSVETLGRYHLHDAVHHLWDVRAAAKRATVAAYDASVATYVQATSFSEQTRSVLDRFLAELETGDHVLEIGSGPGHDAKALEAGGVRVRRTDITEGFVAHLRKQGFAAACLDPLSDDLRDPVHPDVPYAAVWASATLLHVARDDFGTVLGRLAAVTRPGGTLHVSLKEGDGEEWTNRGHVEAPRLFVYWREPALRTALEEAGWEVLEVGHADGRLGDVWLDVLARRRG